MLDHSFVSTSKSMKIYTKQGPTPSKCHYFTLKTKQPPSIPTGPRSPHLLLCLPRNKLSFPFPFPLFPLLKPKPNHFHITIFVFVFVSSMLDDLGSGHFQRFVSVQDDVMGNCVLVRRDQKSDSKFKWSVGPRTIVNVNVSSTEPGNKPDVWVEKEIIGRLCSSPPPLSSHLPPSSPPFGLTPPSPFLSFNSLLISFSCNLMFKFWNYPPFKRFGKDII